MNLVNDWLDAAALKWPEKPAVISKSGTISYIELMRDVNLFALSCMSNSIEIGDRVLIITPNCIESVISIFGVFKAGGVAVCINADSPDHKIMEIVQDCNPKIIISMYPLNGKYLSELTANVYLNKNSCEKLNRQVQYSFTEWLSRSKGVNTENFYIENNSKTNELIAALIYTSGSTGKAKGIVSSHNNIIFSTNAINESLGTCSEDKILSYLPLSFDYGLYQIFLTISSGATLYLRDSKMFAAEIANIIRRESITVLPGLRSLFTFICDRNYVFPSIKYITNTGDSLPTSIVEKLDGCFPNSKINLMYGLSECKRVSILPYKDVKRKPGSVGLPLKGTIVKVMNENYEECYPNEEGELFVQGPNVCLAYWNLPKTSKETFITLSGERWLKTGDLFYKDDDGFLYFLGRKDNMFKSNGYRIEPGEIENEVLLNFPELTDCVVVGLPDRILGNKIGIFIASSSISNYEDTLKKIKLCLTKNLEPWKLPKVYVAGEGAPTTTSGKIDRKKIVEMIENKLVLFNMDN